MLTNDAIRTSPDIRLYSDNLISVLSAEDKEIYWFSKRGLPWRSRENNSLLRSRNYDSSQYSQPTSDEAMRMISGWGNGDCGGR